MRRLLAAVSLLMVGLALLLQAYVLFIELYEVFFSGRTGFASGVVYGAILPFSVLAFSASLVLVYLAGVKVSVKLLCFIYFVSHLAIVVLMFLLPGKFA